MGEIMGELMGESMERSCSKRQERVFDICYTIKYYFIFYSSILCYTVLGCTTVLLLSSGVEASLIGRLLAVAQQDWSINQQSV